jgi:hypothetical protein
MLLWFAPPLWYVTVTRAALVSGQFGDGVRHRHLLQASRQQFVSMLSLVDTGLGALGQNLHCTCRLDAPQRLTTCSCIFGELCPHNWYGMHLITVDSEASQFSVPVVPPVLQDNQEEFEIDLNDDEPEFLKGHSSRSGIEMSPVKIVKNPEGSMQRAAMTAVSAAAMQCTMTASCCCLGGGCGRG